jgi:hypothetical protein
MACELEPPKPKEATEALRSPAEGQGMHAVGNCEEVSKC